MIKLNPGYLLVPHFVNRYYLKKNIGEQAKKYKFKGSVIDIGCGEKPYESLFYYSGSYLGIDFRSFSRNKGYYKSEPDFYFPKNYSLKWRLPFSNSAFDNAVSFQVLEHHPETEKMIAEMARIVKTKGLVMISAPLVWGLHEKPVDYFRFTPYLLSKLLEEKGLKVLELKKLGSFFSVLSSLTTDYLMELANKNKIFFFLALIIYPFLLSGSYLCLLLDQLFKSDDIYLNTLILARKS